MKTYLLIDQYGDKKVVKANTPRQAVVDGYAISPSPKLSPMYRDSKSGTSQIGYVIGQGQGYPSAWVEVKELTSPF